MWQPAITKEEVFFTSKENIEGFVTLLSHFLPQMVSTDVENPSLVNVDNHEEQNDKKPQSGQLFFQSVVQFKDTFARELPKHVGQKVKSITLKTDFSSIPLPVNGKKVQERVCSQAFYQMGLRHTIYAKFAPQPGNGSSLE